LAFRSKSGKDKGKPESGDEASLKLEVTGKGVPTHIAFIMDGNGRWAKARGLPRIAGHRQGVSTVRRMVELGREIGVKVMTFYTFSSENWRRPQFEVSALMELLVDAIDREVEDLKANRVQLKVIGELDSLPEKPRLAMERAIVETSPYNDLILVLALSYSGRGELVRAFNRATAAGERSLSEQNLPQYLDTAGLPDPDLLIRTAGELRLSNFLLYQLAYTEIVVTKKFWPEFGRMELLDCIREFQARERRFGMTSEQIASIGA
jgi:undecaprenyl diphosphate synthase